MGVAGLQTFQQGEGRQAAVEEDPLARVGGREVGHRRAARVIMLENVEEFVTWGRSVDNQPCPKRKGQTFKRWVSALRRLGYAVEWKELRACDYGAPTIRKRFFLVALRRPADHRLKPTHGKAGFA